MGKHVSGSTTPVASQGACTQSRQLVAILRLSASRTSASGAVPCIQRDTSKQYSCKLCRLNITPHTESGKRRKPISMTKVIGNDLKLSVHAEDRYRCWYWEALATTAANVSLTLAEAGDRVRGLIAVCGRDLAFDINNAMTKYKPMLQSLTNILQACQL
eukprot:4326530-Amphidinium_carterae.1